MMPIRISPTLFLPIAACGILLAGCNKATGPDLTAEVQRLTSELDATRAELDAAKKAAAKKADEALLAATPPPAKPAAPTTNAGGSEKDAQIAALQAEVATLKKSEALVFAQASASMQAGTAGAALERYQKFLTDFPNSPLAADADRAIAELTTAAQREARARANMTDPARANLDVLQRFNDGTVTVKEIAPLLKNRGPSDIVKLLGPPNQTYRDGKEFGYVDKVIDTATGGKGTLVIGFDEDIVATLRVGYLGKPIKP